MFHCKKRRIKTLVWKVYFNPFLCHPITECCINIISVRRLHIYRPIAIMITIALSWCLCYCYGIDYIFTEYSTEYPPLYI